jgi:uncharacterized protein (DUF2141 family)
MRAVLKGLALSAAFVSLAIAQTTTQAPPVQNPPRDLAAPAAAAAKLPTGTGFIGGVVTDDGGSRAIANAYVVLIGIGTGIVKVTATDADGRFSFAQLPADGYTVGASKPPFLGTVAGARRPGRPGAPVVIADKQRLTNVAIRMPMGAAITGVITSENGEPAFGVQISAQRWQMQSGIRTAVSVGRAAITDERGQYRLYGLPPGDYIVGAVGNPRPTVPVLTTAEVDAVMRGEPAPPGKAALSVPIGIGAFVPIYFPGTARIADAGTITLTAGQERTAADFRLQAVSTSRVNAQVMTSDGQALPSPISVVLRASGGLLPRTWSARTGPDGQVNMTDIPPGLYLMIATAPSASLMAFANVDVQGSDVFGVELVLRPPASIAGTLAFRSTTPPPSVVNLRVPVRSLEPPNAAAAPNVSATSPQGQFTILNLTPGRYIVGGPISFGPTTDTMNWALESVVVDGKDLTDLPIVVGGDATPKTVTVTYTDVFQELSGRITRAGGNPVADYTIVVFPEDPAYWVWQSRRIIATLPGNDGRFTLSGRGLTSLPAGRYLLAAVADLERDEQFDPAFLGAIAPSAISVVLKPGEKKVQDIVVR